jgi:hypothetical protein
MRELTEAVLAIQTRSKAATEDIQIECGKAANLKLEADERRKSVSFFHCLQGGQRVKIESTAKGVLEVWAIHGQTKKRLIARSEPGKWLRLDQKFDTSVDVRVRYT